MLWTIGEGKRTTTLSVIPEVTDTALGGCGDCPELVRLRFSNGLDLLLPGKWMLQSPERTGTGTICCRPQGNRPTMIRPDDGCREGQAPGLDAGKDQGEMAAEIAELNRLARQERIERRAAEARIRASRHGEGHSGASTVPRMPATSRQGNPPGQNEGVEGSRSRLSGGSRRGKPRPRIPRAGEGGEYLGDLWRRHPEFFRLDEASPEPDGEQAACEARTAPKKNTNRRRPAIILEELIEADRKARTQLVAPDRDVAPVGTPQAIEMH